MKIAALIILSILIIVLIAFAYYVIKRALDDMSDNPDKRRKAVEQAKKEIFEDYGI